LIKDDERYQNLLGQSGSTPLDLFWDIVEDMERDIRLKRNTVQDVMDVRLPLIFGFAAHGLIGYRKSDLISVKVPLSKTLQIS
jgi:hypothetical protein